MIQKYQYGNPLLQTDHKRRGKIDTLVNRGIKQVGIQAKQAEDKIRQSRKADARANRKTKVPSKTITQKQAGFSPITSIQNVFNPVISYISKLFNSSSSKPIQDSKNTNLQAIFDHKNRFDVDKNYAVIDKKNNTLNIYNKDKLVGSYPVTLGLNVGDGMLPLNAKYLGDSPRTTGAGVFTLYGRGTSHYTGNEPYYTMRSDSIGSVAQAIHSPANLTNRREFFRTGKNGRVSYGCVSTDCGVMKKLYKDKTLQTGDSIYVLPEVKGNNLIEKNGKLQMQWKGNNPKTYKDSRGTIRNFRYNSNI